MACCACALQLLINLSDERVPQRLVACQLIVLLNSQLGQRAQGTHNLLGGGCHGRETGMHSGLRRWVVAGAKGNQRHAQAYGCGGCAVSGRMPMQVQVPAGVTIVEVLTRTPWCVSLTRSAVQTSRLAL